MGIVPLKWYFQKIHKVSFRPTNHMTYLKLFLYTILLNILRYFPGGFIESYTIFKPMHQPMEQYPDCFGFTAQDFPSSYAYNFLMWLSVILIFHIAHTSLKGKMIYRSIFIFALCFLFFASLSAIYMNHYIHGIRTFYVYSMLDGVILFSLLGIINGYVYPLFFKHENN